MKTKFLFSSSLLWILPLLLFLMYLPFSTYIDQNVASFFLGSNTKFKAPTWCLFIYTYGLLPGQLLFLGTTILFLASFFAKKIIQLRLPALYISMTLIIGSGIFGHALLKQFWVRPRPKQVALYGGKYPFCPLLKPYKGTSDRFLRSLPSGHATMGFYFFSLYFIGLRMSRRKVVWSGMILTGLFGGLLTWARLAQGGHFLSDIIVSALLMWMTAYWLDRLFSRYFASYSKPLVFEDGCESPTYEHSVIPCVHIASM